MLNSSEPPARRRAFVGEEYDDGIRALTKFIPNSGTQSAHYISGGQDLLINSQAREKLKELKYNIVTYNEAVIKARNKDLVKPIRLYARTNVTLRFKNPEFIKSAFPAGGTMQKPGTVVQNSILKYTLTITNPDPELPMYDVTLEDVFPLDLVPNNDYRVSFHGGTDISVDSTDRVTYTLVNKYNDSEELVSRVFTAKIDVIDLHETVAITIPVKVLKEKDSGTFSNQARVTSINGVPYENLPSNTTYHEVTGVKAKILKVNAKDEPLEGAVLQIYQNNSTSFDNEGNLKEGAQPIELINSSMDEPKTSFTSTDEVIYFDIEPDSYVLHEVTAPENYKKSADIPFTVDVEGIIHVNGESVDYVKMVDEPPYKVVFRENKPDGTDDEKQKAFRVFDTNLR